MILRKSKITYVFWVLYIILGLGTAVAASYNMKEITGLLPVSPLIGGVALALVVLVVSQILALFSKFIIKIQKSDQHEISTFIEMVLLFFVLIILFMVRFVYITQISGVVTGDRTFINVISNRDVNRLTSLSPIQYLFYEIAVNIKGYFATADVASMYLNSALQLVAVVLMYFVARRMMGFIPAFVATVVYAILPCNIFYVSSVDGDSLFAVLLGLSMLFVVLAKWSAVNNKLNHYMIILLLAISGALSGFTIMSDISALGIVIFSVVLLASYKETGLYSSSNRGKIIVYFIGLCLGFYGAGALYGQVYNLSALDYIVDRFIKLTNININYSVITPGNSSIYSLIVIAFALVWIFRIFKIERDHGSMFVVVPFVMALISLLSGTSGILTASYMLLWCVLAGMGFVSIGKNSLEYLEREKEARERSERERQEKMAEAKKELEERKSRLQEKEKAKKSKGSEATATNEGDTQMSDTQNLKALEAQLEFLQKDTDDKNEQNEETREDIPDDSKENAQEEIQDDSKENTTSDFSHDMNVDSKGLSEVGEASDLNISASGEESKAASIDTSINTTADSSDNASINATDSVSANVSEDKIVEPNHYAAEKPPVKVAPLTKEDEKPRYVSMSSPSSKFARRMDYKTAIVKSNHIEDNTVTNTVDNTASTVGTSAETNATNEVENTTINANSTINTDTETNANVDTNVNANSDNGVSVNSVNAEQNTNEISDQNVAKIEAANAAKDETKIEEKIDDTTSKGTVSDGSSSKVIDADEEIVPDLMSVNIIESKVTLDETKDEVADEESSNAENNDKVLDENTLDLTSMEKSVLTSDPTPVPEPNPVSASEPVLRSVVAEKVPILGAETEPLNKIHNPLPTPKKHVSKDMDFDIDPLEVDMHFDIVDLTGKDFFDIN